VRGKYSSEFKIKFVREQSPRLQVGTTIKKIANEFNIPRSTCGDWFRTYKERAPKYKKLDFDNDKKYEFLERFFDSYDYDCFYDGFP
jgi:transposase